MQGVFARATGRYRPRGHPPRQPHRRAAPRQLAARRPTV